MAGRVVIPIHDENGFLVAYAGRSLDETDPKYRFPPRFRKSLVLFNLHRAAAEGKSVIVVEGFFDCFKVHQASAAGTQSHGSGRGAGVHHPHEAAENWGTDPRDGSQSLGFDGF